MNDNNSTKIAVEVNGAVVTVADRVEVMMEILAVCNTPFAVRAGSATKFYRNPAEVRAKIAPFATVSAPFSTIFPG